MDITEACKYPFRRTPYKHQLATWLRSRELAAFALWLDMGTGKSKVLIDTAAWLFDEGKINSLVVLAPKGVFRNWGDAELPTHMPEHIRYQVGVWTAERRKADVEALDQFLAPAPSRTLRVLLMNIEALGRDLEKNKAYDLLEEFLRGGRALLAVDESTVIKNPKATRTKALKKLRTLAPYRRILSGQPAPNGPLDLYSQCEFLDPSILGFSSFFSFKAHYAVLAKGSCRTGEYDAKTGEEKRREFQMVKGFKNVDELHRKVSRFAAIVKKEDCLDLPAKVFQTRLVSMGAKQKKAYDQMRRMAIVEIKRSIDPSAVARFGAEAVQQPMDFLAAQHVAGLENPPEIEQGPQAFMSTARLVITQMLRLHQILCGFLVTDDGKATAFDEENPRLEELMQVLDECSGKVVIFATYRLSVRQIEERIAKDFGAESVVTYYGDTSSEDRRTAIKRFQGDTETPHDPACRFFVTNKTGARGITLTQSHTAVLYSYDPDLDIYLQFLDRIHRIGQMVSCTYVRLSAGPKTVDDKYLASLDTKEALTKVITASNWAEFL